MNEEEWVVKIELDKTGIRESQLVEIREPGSLRTNDRGKLISVNKIQMSPADAVKLHSELTFKLKDWHYIL